jgi:hypothetical protein
VPPSSQCQSRAQAAGPIGPGPVRASDARPFWRSLGGTTRAQRSWRGPQIQPAVIAQRRDEHIGYVKIAGGESIAGPVLAGKEAEAGAAVAIERMARTVAEDRITSPFGHSSSLSGLAGGRLS